MRDFEWTDTLWAVIKEDGSFAGCPCLCYEEARELANQHEGSVVFRMESDDLSIYDEPNDIDDDCGYDPYMGCFTDDC